jgi:hydrogenase expression/formation protein HypC
MCLGIPGKIISIIDHQRQVGMVDVGGVQRAVSLSCIAPEDQPLETCVGAWVLVHVGFAMSRIDEAEAQATLEVLIELGEMQSELEAIQMGAS